MEFYEHLKTYLNEEEINKLKLSLEDEPKSAVLLNTKKMDDETFKSLYKNVIPHPIVKHAYLFNKNEYQLGKSIYHELGCFYIQEPSAMIPSFLLSPNEGELVLDMCAAPGGKSIQASFLMNNKGLIISNDISNKRAMTIVDNVERLGIGNIHVISTDLEAFLSIFENKFDKIILDAPCSGSGMFRKNSLMEDDWSINKVYKFQETQIKLLLNAYKYLKPGGVICYSTCSFSKEEDEDVITTLLNNTDAELINIDDNPLFYKSDSGIGIHLLPSYFPGEGHYICLIKKPGEIKRTTFKESKLEPWCSLLPNNDYHYSFHFVDTLFIASELFPLKAISSLRYGVKVGELINNKIKYDYHYSHFINDFPNKYNLSDSELVAYLQGNTINARIAKGDVLLRYNNINVDIAKSDGNIIKNHYPKRYRKKIIL